MLEQISEMEENFKRAKKGDFKVSLHSMEVIFKDTMVFMSYMSANIFKFIVIAYAIDASCLLESCHS